MYCKAHAAFVFPYTNKPTEYMEIMTLHPSFLTLIKHPVTQVTCYNSEQDN